MSATETTLQTALHAAHVASGARMVPFAGYDMPVQYVGIMAEAKSVRDDAGMFDVSHMARLSFTGEGAEAFLENCTSNDISSVPPLAGQYSLLPNDRGGCVDDIIVYRLADGFQMVVNASNHAKDVEWLRAHMPSTISLRDLTDDTAMIAVQGPGAVERLSTLTKQCDLLHAAPAFGVVAIELRGVPVQAARSGYTGEDGYEITCAARDAMKVWDALLGAGVAPCGLGARDTLRVEAGLPLYGHELNDDLSPIASGLGWVVSKTKSFIGCEPINRARAEGTPRRLVGAIMNSKRLAPPGTAILVEGQVVGEVSSGVISPMLDTGIAFAFVNRAVPLDTPCVVDTRGKQEPGKIVNKRFYRRQR